MTLTLSWRSRRFTSYGDGHQPDAVLLFNHRETWGPGRLNCPEHRNGGQASLAAGRSRAGEAALSVELFSL